MNPRSSMLVVTIGALLAVNAAQAQRTPPGTGWQQDFDLSKCTMAATGRNPYFVLEPGYQLVLEGGDTRVQITVSDETRTVAGVTTRVVEEREWKDGKLYEVARNFFAICEQTKDVYYFGEEVDFYENGKVVKHDGTWVAGRSGNRFGLMMPGTPKVSMKYYQELAPGVAMDRAEIVSLTETCKTPAGTFASCMKVKEGSALSPATEFKYHAPGIGLVRDEDLRLVRYGYTTKK